MPNSYVATEAMYHLMGGREAGWIPHAVHHEGEDRWFLKHKDGRVLDFVHEPEQIPRHKARPRAFKSMQPSAPARELMDKIRLDLASKRGQEHLEKGIGTTLAMVGALTLGQMSPKLQAAFDKVNPPEKQAYSQVVQTQPQWTPDGLHPYLIPIAHLESSFGKFMNHAPNSKGDYHTAFGPVGFKPSTAHEEWSKSKVLKAKFPGLEEPTAFMDKFKKDWNFHNLVASSHFLRLLHRHGTPEKAAYAWRWGSTAASGATDEAIHKDSYVMRFRDLSASAGIKKAESRDIEVQHYSTRPGLKELHPSFQGTGVTGAEKARPKRIPRTYFYFADAQPEGVILAAAPHKYVAKLPSGTKLYDMGEDHLGLTRPSWKQTQAGQFYHVPDLDLIEKKLVKLGYHGYHNYGIPGALAYFHPLKVQHVETGGRPVRKSEDLDKMAIKDIAPGQRLNDVDEFDGEYDYTHVLPEEHRKAGYTLNVRHMPSAMDNDVHTLTASVWYPHFRTGRPDAVAHVTGKVFGQNGDIRVSDMDDSRTDIEQHQGKGLGMAAYEAMYAHMYHKLGVRQVEGGTHSTLAARTHQKIADKHDLNYPNRDKKIGRGYPFDGKYGPYRYALKSET